MHSPDYKRDTLKILTVLILVLTVFTLIGSSGLITRVDGERRGVVAEGESFNLSMNVTRPGNYSIEILDPAGNVVESGDMEMTHKGVEKTLNYHVDKLPFNGNGKVKVIREDYSNRTYLTETDSIHVTSENPDIFEWKVMDDFVKPGEEIKVRMNISDTEEDLENVYYSHDGETFPGSIAGGNNTNSSNFSSQDDTSDNYDTYEMNYTPDTSGDYSFNVTAEDSSGSTDSENISVNVKSSSEGSASGTIGTSVKKECKLKINNFDVPGMDRKGTFDVIAKGETGLFTAELYNSGSLDMNVTAMLNVTRENSSFSYALSDDSEVIKSYDDEFFEIPLNYSERSAEDYLKEFDTEREAGFYAGRIFANYTCKKDNKTIKKNTTRSGSFLIINATGGADEYGDRITNNTIPADANRTGEESNQTVPAEANQTGEESNQTVPAEANQTGEESNQTTPADANQTGESSNRSHPADANETGEESNQTTPAEANQTGESSNRSHPADANETGEESNQTLEGNESEPGSTPEPDPEPQLSIEMRNMNETVSTKKEQTVSNRLEIENWHGQSVENISISAMTERFDADWNSSKINIDQVDGNASMDRDILLTPSDDVEPGNHYVPVVARTTGERDLDVEYLNVHVEKEVFEPKLEIIEMPRNIEVGIRNNKTIPVLVKNRGSRNLTDINSEVVNIEGLGNASTESLENLSVNETGSLSIDFRSVDQVKEGNITAVVKSSEGAYAYGDIGISIEETGLYVPQKFRVPLVATVWTAVLMMYAVFTKLYGLKSLFIKVPYILLILGEVTLMLYLASNYYGFETLLLPF